MEAAYLKVYGRRLCESIASESLERTDHGRRHAWRRRRSMTMRTAGIDARTIRKAISPIGSKNQFWITGASDPVHSSEKFPGPPAVSATRVTKLDVDQGKSKVLASRGENTASSPRVISSLYKRMCTLGTDEPSSETVSRLSLRGARVATSRGRPETAESLEKRNPIRPQPFPNPPSVSRTSQDQAPPGSGRSG